MSSFVSALAQKLESVAPVDGAAVRADAAATDGLLLPQDAQSAGRSHLRAPQPRVNRATGTAMMPSSSYPPQQAPDRSNVVAVSVSDRVLGSSSAPRSRWS